MFDIGGAVKWVAIAGIISGLIFGVKAIHSQYEKNIEEAVSKAKLEFNVERDDWQRKQEKIFQENLRVERESIEKELKVEREKVNDLQRMLLIEHDLDRLLQRKPGLILTRVNKGTDEYYQKLQELTEE